MSHQNVEMNEFVLLMTIQIAKDSGGKAPTEDEIKHMCIRGGVDFSSDLKSEILEIFPEIKFTFN